MLPLGRVLNRFSKDIGFMDDLLPLQFVELFTVSEFNCSYCVLLICCYLVIAEVCGHCDSGLCGQLLAVHSCCNCCWSTAAVSLVLFAHIKRH